MTRSGRRSPAAITSLADLEALVASGTTSLRDRRLQDLDLTAHGEVLRRLDVAGALFLGGRLTPAEEDSLRDRGALLFPSVPDVPFDAYRTTLYTPDELYAGLADGYDATPDAQVYAWSRHGDTGAGQGVAADLALALHDHAVDTALAGFVRDRRLVGVMGGHAAARGTREYADAARLGRALARTGLEVATGGGPGAMEAANLGARTAPGPDALLDRALARLAGVPGFRPSVTDWARVALEVAADLPPGPRTLGIPTWFYGHEPPNPFATDIAKFFRNALREALLVGVCTAGLVFLPGAAGTVQEVFQDACENYYADDPDRAPMVLVGRRFWTETVPAWPLLSRLADDGGFSARVWLVDSPEEAAERLAG